MHGINPTDKGRRIDWGKTSDDYAVYRAGYPDSFYERITALGIGRPGQRLLDLGTGTGVLARAFAQRGCDVTGVDISPEQIETARRLAGEEGLAADFQVAPAEETALPNRAFDAITSAQSWLYFDRTRAIPEVCRLLATGGRFMTCHLCWLPRQDEIARRTEELVLSFNPDWSAGDWPGVIPAEPAWAKDQFRVTAMFYYDETIPFTRETWRGRIRACRGIGASLSAEEVARFDEAHTRLLAETVGDTFTVLHRIDAHIFEPIESRE